MLEDFKGEQKQPAKVDKQELIENSILELKNSIDVLEKFACRVEDNFDSKITEENKTERLSLSNYIDKLPEIINANRQSIENYVAKLTELLY